MAKQSAVPFSALPERVRIVEVGPRDGLQNEARSVPADVKIEFINRLSKTGLEVVETTSFVSPRWIPQLADADEVFRGIDKADGVAYPVLVPNVAGMERALAAGAREVAVFTAASETFNRKNINASIAESIDRFEPVLEMAKANDVRVRAYISCVLGCPYEGDIKPEAVAPIAERLIAMGCYEISLGDTIGVGTPLAARRLVQVVQESVDISQLAVHFHDTRGQALANILACVEIGVAVVDASVTGLGGCPYANGAPGNVATEEVVYMLNGMGIETGVDLDTLVDAGLYISEALGRLPTSDLAKLQQDKPSPDVDTGFNKF
ncbi:MAG: hydroxymethylglutaryl-CoA lyase [Pseudomonadota bacterium]